MLSNYLKVALRNLARHKLYSAINIFGLAIGLACFGLIAAWVMNELGYDRFHENHERIVRLVGRVTTEADSFDQAVTSSPLAEALVRDYPEVERAVRLTDRGAIVRYEDKQFDEDNLLFADESFFDMFSYDLTLGDKGTALRDPYSIILTQSMSEKYFGSENPVGKTLTIFLFDPDGKGAPYKVTGVMPDPPQNSHVVFNFLGSFNTYETAEPASRTSEWRWFWNGFYTYLLLKEGSDLEALEAKLPEFAERYLGEKMTQMRMFYTFSLQPLDDIYLHSDLRYEIQVTGSLDTVVIFATIGVFVLAIACINYMNLATARALGRAKEVGIRKILGVTKADLIRQFLLEAALFAGLSLVLAFLFMELNRSFVSGLTGKPLENIFSGALLALLLGTTLLAGFCSGLYPALFLSSFKPMMIVKAWKSTSASVFVRKGLVVLQFVVSITLLIGTGLVWNQMEYIRSKDLGFNKEELLVLNQNGFSEVNAGIGSFREALLSHSGISGVATSRGLIVGGLSNWHIETVDGSGKPISTSIYQHQVSFEYLDVYQMKLLAGRQFVPTDTGSAYIVNETAVNVLGWGTPENALGKPFRTGDSNNAQVIGVVRDFHFSSLENPIEPVAVSLAGPGQFSRISIRVAASQLQETIMFIKQTWQEHFPRALLQYSFMNERLDRQYESEKIFGKVFLLFVFLSLIVASLGLFGLASFATEQRVKEVGIRRVLGASVSGVVRLLSKDFLKLVAVANILAWPLAYYVMNRWLEDFAYRIEISWWVFALAGGLAFVIAILTVSVQAIRAALANPVEALRYE
ncbi:MAG TPA: ABC transporter permease [Bacteroidota bacterium]